MLMPVLSRLGESEHIGCILVVPPSLRLLELHSNDFCFITLQKKEGLSNPWPDDK